MHISTISSIMDRRQKNVNLLEVLLLLIAAVSGLRGLLGTMPVLRHSAHGVPLTVGGLVHLLSILLHL